MKKLLSIIFAMIITLPALAMDITVTVLDENNEPLLGATIFVIETQQSAAVGTNGQSNTNVKLTNVPDGATIKINCTGYEEKILAAQPAMSVKMEPTSEMLESVNIIGCPSVNGIKTVTCEKCTDPDQCKTDGCSGTCVVQACHEPCYKLNKKSNKCEMQSVDGGMFTFLNNQCQLTCLAIAGYTQDPKNQWKCTQDCTSSVTDPNVKSARYKGNKNPANLKCEITECKGKYHPSDDKQSCIPDKGDCTAEQLAAVHASTGYLITAQNKCVPKDCLKPQYAPDGSGDSRVCVDQVGKTCNVKNATSAKYQMIGNELKCVVEKCDTNNGYQRSSDKLSCEKNCLSDAQTKEPLATAAEYNSAGKCIITKCNKKDGKQYIPNEDDNSQSCMVTERPCNKETDKTIWPEHATAALYTKTKNSVAKCSATECEPGYKPVKGQCVNQVGQPCKISHAKEAKYELRDNKLVCVVVSCDTAKGYTKTDDGTECIKDCLSTAKNTELLATKAEFDSAGKCIIKKCDKKDGKKYIPSDDGQKCEETERDCDKQTDSKIWPEHATAASYKKSKTGSAAKCVATECEDGYDVNGGICTSVNDSDCDTKPENSKKSHRYYDASAQQTLCIIDECKDGYKISNDLLSCILESALSEEDAKKRMEELKENAKKMKDKEQSFENKLLGAAGMATVGIGGMNIASALSEQSADRQAEDDMKAYLATFRCDYGQGRNILGGETGIQLPGASELIQYTTEYKQLAADLKASKDALGMLPGIESETIFDSATTGLYDDVGIGTQKGAFTSLSRALMDENSADAAEWQAMKDATAKKLKTGAIVAGAGALGTLAANIAINHGKGDKSDDILNAFEGEKQPTDDISPERKPCPAGTTGVYIPNCECPGNSYFNINDSCIPCGENQIVNANKNGCECDTANGYQMVPGKDPLECKKPSPTCQLTGYFIDPPCKCQEGATQNGTNCVCNEPGYIEESNTCKKCNLTGLTKNYNCKCVDNAENIGGVCTCKQGYEPNGQGGCKQKEEQQTPPETPGTPETPITVQTSAHSDSTFGPGECAIDNIACNTIVTNIQTSLNKAFTSQSITYDNWKNNSTASKQVTIEIAGYTDRQGFKQNQIGKCLNRNVSRENTSDLNKELSEKRAWAMHECIQNNKSKLFGNATVTYKPSNQRDMGKGQEACTKCDTSTKKVKVCENCRRVDIKIKVTK